MTFIKSFEKFNESEKKVGTFLNYNFKKLPTLYYKGAEYKGDASFINGDNGHTKSTDDSVLCALIDNSCWDKEGNCNYLLDKNNDKIYSDNRRGQTITIIF